MDSFDPNLTADSLAISLVQAVKDDRLSDAASAIEAFPHSLTMGAAFSSAVRALYREHKNVSLMLLAAMTGLEYCLRRAENSSDVGVDAQLMRIGFGISFNTAANCWPGWGDPGITISRGDLAAGIGVAEQCLALAHDLSLPPREQGGAHWLVGALELARGRFEIARIQFALAERVYRDGDVGLPYILMARGYQALVGNVRRPSSTECAKRLAKGIEDLRNAGSKEAIFFAEQIANAKSVFLPDVAMS